MKRRSGRSERTADFERSYRSALRRHVKSGPGNDAGERIGRRAGRVGITTLELARMHERSAADLPSASRAARRTDEFFADAVAPLEAAHSGARTAIADAARLESRVARATSALLSARERIARSADRHRATMARLSDCRKTGDAEIRRSRELQERLRGLSRRILVAQEEERLRISHDLHDAIAQTLTGINVGLATLKRDAAEDSRSLADAITLTQHLVERSMKIVHQFAWELRPTLLDDLGVVPALRSYTKAFAERTGIRVRFEADAQCARLDADRSVALFRVAQGALSNVERHSGAKNVKVVLRSNATTVSLDVTDDGSSFDVAKAERSAPNEHLGMLVMRERAEMTGGKLSITSAPGRGTRVRGEFPLTGDVGA